MHISIHRWCSGKESTYQFRRHKRHEFKSWVGRSPGGGNGNSPQYSCLENSLDKEAWWATVHGVAKSWTWLNTHNITDMWQSNREKREKKFGWCWPTTIKYFYTIYQIANPYCGLCCHQWLPNTHPECAKYYENTEKKINEVVPSLGMICPHRLFIASDRYLMYTTASLHGK